MLLIILHIKYIYEYIKFYLMGVDSSYVVWYALQIVLKLHFTHCICSWLFLNIYFSLFVCVADYEVGIYMRYEGSGWGTWVCSNTTCIVCLLQVLNSNSILKFQANLILYLLFGFFFALFKFKFIKVLLTNSSIW